MWKLKRKLRILDIDIENRPLSYLGMDWTSAEITAIAWCWIGDTVVNTFLLRPDSFYDLSFDDAMWEAGAVFDEIRSLLKEADLVTGHYIRKHDLPIINSALIENDLEPLPNILTQDTKCDLVKKKDLSASQENLAAMFDLPQPKHHMTQTEWRKANRLTKEGIEATRKRVVSDVEQHMALRTELLKRKLLRPPRVWRP